MNRIPQGGRLLVKVRKARSSDLPKILDLYEQLTEQKITVSSRKAKRVFDQISAMPNLEFIVAEKEGAVVGSLVCQVVPNLSHDARPWAVIENMVVDQELRRQGVGRILIEEAFRLCRKQGCYKVQLLSHKRRTEAHQFYRSLGFGESALGFRKYFD